MKTKKLLIISALLFINLFSLSAKAEKSSQIPRLDKMIRSSLSYPEDARRNGVTGFVLVELQTNQDGSVRICQINSNNEYLKNYVIGQLGHLKIGQSGADSQETHIYRINFKLK